MLYCKSCRVWVAGAHQRCPLCGVNLSGKREEAPSYPELPENRSFTKRLIQIISGAALTAAIICVAVNLLVPTGIWWSLFAVLGLGCGWLWAVVGIVKKAKLLNNIVWQLRMPDRDYMIHLILCAVLGVVPLVFLFTGVLGVIAPSVICTAASLIVISLQLIFNWKAMYREIHKKLHL